jgi:hypothetical protein
MKPRPPLQAQTQVVKVQLPIEPAGEQVALIYDAHREHEQMRALDEEEHRLMGGRLKRFFNAWWSDATGWVLLGRVNARGW